MSESLKNDTSLTLLHLRCDKKEWIEMREKNEKWNKWYIGNHIGSEGAGSLSELVRIRPSLRDLDLSCDEKKKWTEKKRTKKGEKREMNS